MSRIFNKNDYNYNNSNYVDDDTMYVNRNGDILNGGLSMPYLTLTSATNPIHFPDGTYQDTAFNSSNVIITEIKSDITQLKDDTETLKNSTSLKTTAITYFPDPLFKTEIANNCFITNLTCGNINTSHLSGTNSNVQTQLTTLQNAIQNTSNFQSQINTLNTKTANIIKFLF